MTEFFDKALVERRSLEQVLSDLRTRYERRPGPELAEKIQKLESRNLASRGGTRADSAQPEGLSRRAPQAKRKIFTNFRIRSARDSAK